MSSAWKIFKEFEPFCWFGRGYCKPEPVVHEAKDENETVGGAKYFFSEPPRFSLEWMGVEFNPNFDNICVLTMAIMISSLTALIVAGCCFSRRRDVSREPERIPERLPQSEPEHPFTEDNDPDDKPPASAAAEASIPSDMNNNNPTASVESPTGSSLNSLSSWIWKKKAPMNENSTVPVEPLSVDSEPTISIHEIRMKAMIERVRSSEVGTNITPTPHLLKPGKRVTVRSLAKFLDNTKDPILVVHKIQRRSTAVLFENIESLKLETFIRLCGIPHLVVSDGDRDKGIWISYAGIDYFGIEKCIELINTQFPTACQSCQIPIQKKIVPTRYIQILAECDLHWAVIAWRSYHRNENDSIYYGLGENEKLHNSYMQMCHKNYEGMNPDKIILEIEKDLESLNVSLGKKNFFIGESMTIVDCSVFAILAQFMWNVVPNNSHATLKRLIQKHPDLIRYTTSIRDKLWPDWEWDSEIFSPHLIPRESHSNISHDDPVRVDYMELDNSQFGRVSSESEVPKESNSLMENICQMLTKPPRASRTPSYRSSKSGIAAANSKMVTTFN